MMKSQTNTKAHYVICIKFASTQEVGAGLILNYLYPFANISNVLIYRAI